MPEFFVNCYSLHLTSFTQQEACMTSDTV